MASAATPHTVVVSWRSWLLRNRKTHAAVAGDQLDSLHNQRSDARIQAETQVQERLIDECLSPLNRLKLPGHGGSSSRFLGLNWTLPITTNS